MLDQLGQADRKETEVKPDCRGYQESKVRKENKVVTVKRDIRACQVLKVHLV